MLTIIPRLSRNVGVNNIFLERLHQSVYRSYSTEIIETEYGPVRGSYKPTALGRKFYSFQGIPYMKPPLGRLRFKDAKPPMTWDEPLDVTKEPPAYCMLEFLHYKIGGQENAGVVNVYTPYTRPIKPLPVLVWIHGGGWNSGSGQTDLFGPDYFMQKDVVLVTMNYRLGPVGFLSLDDPDVNVPGNAGLKDQTFALKWVKRNIANFGGDAKNVTVVGQSAGGASTHYHMIADHSKGLLNKAICMSGNSFSKAWALVKDRDWNLRLAKNLGYSGKANDKDLLAFLEKPDGMSIVRAASKVLTPQEAVGLHVLFAFGPVIEPYVSKNCFIPKDPILMAREAWSKDINLLTGATSNECIISLRSNAAEMIDVMKNTKYFAPLVQLGIDVNSDKAEEYGQLVKKLYYGNSTPSESCMMPYLKFMSDFYSWFGLQQVLTSRINQAGSGKNFVYRFDVDGSQNYAKLMLVAPDDYSKYPGASHCDDLPYLFKTGPPFSLPSPTLDSVEFKVIKKMVETFTTFASTGDPNNQEIGKKWTAVESLTLPFSCMNIKNDENQMIPLPEAEHFEAWKKMFERENVNLY